MQVKRQHLAISLIAAIVLCAASSAQQIESMKLLTPNTGWAATKKKLFWTNDGGAQWKDVTPKIGPDRTITSAFYLNSARGWVLLAHKDKENKQTGISEALFELASTDDAGNNWSLGELVVHDPDPSRGLSAETWLDFADAMHGWLLVRVNGNTAMSGGVFLATDDGGVNWRTLGVPAAGPFRFITPMDGWLDAGANAEAAPGLYATRNGGKDWAPVNLEAPPGFGARKNPTYALPEFENTHSGSILVTFAEPNDEAPKLTLFTTEDGGRSWSLRGSQTNGGSSWQTTYAGGEWLALGCLYRELSALRVTKGGIHESRAAKIASEAVCQGGGIDQISFVDGMRGWVLLAQGGLLSTSDGGLTWEGVTPPGAGAAGETGGRSIDASVSKRVPATKTAPHRDTASSNVSTHLGFDRFPVIPKASDMQTWMNSSPFYDVGIYLPGSLNKSPDANLTLAWTSAIAGQQGWGIMPLWFGVQSACSCYVNSTGQCVPFTYQISTNTTQATAQGVSEANAAISSARALGLSPSVIYKDIENYTPDGSTCSLPVRAYLNGWDKQMQTVGAAGVYGNPLPAAQDFAKASPVPNDVWIAKYSSPPQLTVWGLGKLADSTNWANGQRIHQVQQNLKQTWATTAYFVDPDIENGPVVNANNGSKTFTYTYTNVNYPGATGTYVAGINDIWNTSIINGPGLVGQIVGLWVDANAKSHGFLSDGLVGYTSLDYPGAAGTGANGINNSGQIVGNWVDANGSYHGFLYGGTCSSFCSLDYPGALGTYATGINDAGQISGYYTDASDYAHGFFYYGGTFYPINYPGSAVTVATGINGDGIIAGQTASSYSFGFVQYPIPPTWSGLFSSFSYAGAAATYPLGINNNNQVTGYYDLAGSDFGFQFSYGDLFTSFQYPGSTYTSLSSANDFEQIVGDTSDYGGGFVAVPQ